MVLAIIINGGIMLYSPKVREDLVKKLYQLKQATPAKIPMTKIVNEAVEDYLNKKGVNHTAAKKTTLPNTSNHHTHKYKIKSTN